MLLAVGIIYPISDSQWISSVQVVPKKSGMTIIKNRQDEMVPTKIQNRWRQFARTTFRYRKSHFFFLDGFSSYMQIHIVPVDQHKTTFTCLFGTFAYTRMPFGLCNALSTFQRCMISVFSGL
ncbi:hypothetical protein CR513_31633, partial [Mucuna pruriens]